MSTSTKAPGRLWWGLSIALAFGIVAWLAVTVLGEKLPPDELQSPQPLGMPLRVTDADGDRLLLLTERYGRRHFWGYANGMRWGKPASEPFLDIDLWALDAKELRVLWQQRLRADDPDFQTTEHRIAGVADGRLLVDLGELVAVSPRDGTALAGALPGAMPEPPWSGFDSARLLVRGHESGDRWVGLLTDAEVAKLTGADGHAQGWHPEALGAVGVDAAYRLWTARVHAGDGPGGRAPKRWSDYRPLPYDATFRAGGLLTTSTGAVVGADAASVVVLSRDDDGGLVLDRVGLDAGAPAWRTPLAQTELAQVSDGPGGLLLYGHTGAAGLAAGEAAKHALLTAIGHADGHRTDLPVSALAPRARRADAD